MSNLVDEPIQPVGASKNRLLLDSFIVISPHITGGQYHEDPDGVQTMIEQVERTDNGDLDRVYFTGVSRGGHGAWGLASKLPDTFAVIAPMGGSTDFATGREH